MHTPGRALRGAEGMKHAPGQEGGPGEGRWQKGACGACPGALSGGFRSWDIRRNEGRKENTAGNYYRRGILLSLNGQGFWLAGGMGPLH